MGTVVQFAALRTVRGDLSHAMDDLLLAADQLACEIARIDRAIQANGDILDHLPVVGPAAADLEHLRQMLRECRELLATLGYDFSTEKRPDTVGPVDCAS